MRMEIWDLMRDHWDALSIDERTLVLSRLDGIYPKELAKFSSMQWMELPSPVWSMIIDYWTMEAVKQYLTAHKNDTCAICGEPRWNWQHGPKGITTSTRGYYHDFKRIA